MSEVHGHHQHTKEVVDRLSRIEGHVRAIKRMVEEQRACPDVLIQLAAVKSAVDSASKVVLTDHVESCIRDAAATGSADAEWMRLKEALDRYIG